MIYDYIHSITTLDTQEDLKPALMSSLINIQLAESTNNSVLHIMYLLSVKLFAAYTSEQFASLIDVN